MAATFGDLIEEVQSTLSGYGLVRSKMATLAAAITSTTTTLTADSVANVDSGVIELDQEMLYVSTKDESANTLTIPAWGRGYGGTTAASHAINARLTVNPRFPRFRVATAINEEIIALYPDLFGVAVDATQSTVSVKIGYPVPADVESIMSVDYRQIGPAIYWRPVGQYQLDPTASTTDFPTGKALNIFSLMQPGRVLRIQYRKRLSALVNETDLLTTSGLAESARDLVVLGALYRLLLAIDPARLQTSSLEANHNRDSLPPGTSQGIARQLLQLHEARKAQERRLLLQQYPMTTTNRF